MSRQDECMIENEKDDVDILIAAGVEPSVAYDIVSGRALSKGYECESSKEWYLLKDDRNE